MSNQRINPARLYGATSLTPWAEDGAPGLDGLDGEDGAPGGALSDLKLYEYSINPDGGGDFFTCQELINEMSEYSVIAGVRIVGRLTGFDTQGLTLWRDLSAVNIVAENDRAPVTMMDHVNAFAPDWKNDPSNDSNDHKMNTLYRDMREAVSAMLATKYTAGISTSTKAIAGVALQGFKFGELAHLLISGGLETGNCIETGNGPRHGEGAELYLRACSIHGAGASGVTNLYGGSLRAWQAAHGEKTFISCCGTDGRHFQYDGVGYDEGMDCFGNFNDGRRIKIQGLEYAGKGQSWYNRQSGTRTSGGGSINNSGGSNRFNGGSGLFVEGLTTVLMRGAGSENSDNGDHGIQAGGNSDLDLTGGKIERNGAHGVYAINGAQVTYDGATILDNGGSSVVVKDGGQATAVNAELGNPGDLNTKIIGHGFIAARQSKIYGAPSVFGQCHNPGRGAIDVTGSTDENDVPLTHADCTPDMNTPNEKFGLIIGDLPGTAELVRSDAIAGYQASSPALINGPGSAARPNIIPNQGDPNSGFTRGQGGSMSLVHNNTEGLSVFAGVTRFSGVLKQGAHPGVQVVGPQRTGWTFANGGYSISRDASALPAMATPESNREIINALLSDLRNHGLIES